MIHTKCILLKNDVDSEVLVFCLIGQLVFVYFGLEEI